MENEIKLTGNKLNKRVKRVVDKVFEKEISLDEVFLVGEDNSEDEEKARPT